MLNSVSDEQLSQSIYHFHHEEKQEDRSCRSEHESAGHRREEGGGWKWWGAEITEGRRRRRRRRPFVRAFGVWSNKRKQQHAFNARKQTSLSLQIDFVHVTLSLIKILSQTAENSDFVKSLLTCLSPEAYFHCHSVLNTAHWTLR